MFYFARVRAASLPHVCAMKMYWFDSLYIWAYHNHSDDCEAEVQWWYSYALSFFVVPVLKRDEICKQRNVNKTKKRIKLTEENLLLKSFVMQILPSLPYKNQQRSSCQSIKNIKSTTLPLLPIFYHIKCFLLVDREWVRKFFLDNLSLKVLSFWINWCANFVCQQILTKCIISILRKIIFAKTNKIVLKIILTE